jgi:hypothetical protein
MAHRQALDIEPAPPKQADRAIQHARPILHQRDNRMLIVAQVFLLLIVRG